MAFGRPWGEPDATHSWVDVDGAAGTAAVVEHLVAQSHRRIAFVGWPEGSGVGDDRYAGWLRATAAHRLPTRGLVRRSEDGIAAGAALTDRLLEPAQPPTAVVCVSDVMALGALRALEDHGLRAGAEVAVTGFDDSPLTTVVRPGLTSVRQPLEAVAERVIEVLLDHLTGSPTHPAHVLLDPELVVRDSSDRGGPRCGRHPSPSAKHEPRVRSDRR